MTDERPSDVHEDQQADERWDDEGGAADAHEPEDPVRTRREKAWDDARGEHWHGAKSSDETQARADVQEDDRRDRETGSHR